MKFSIKELRARFKLTQEQAAKAVGISEDRWSRYERNPGMIPMGIAAKMAALFDVKLDDILL